MVPEQKLSPDTAQIEAHLRHLTRRWHELGQPVVMEVVHLTADDKAIVKDVARFSPDDMGISLAVDHIAAMNAHGVNSYVTVNPIDATRPLRAGHRAETADIAGSFYHFADGDTQQAADNIRNFVGPKCTFVVVTGTIPHVRPHVYWELEEPTRNLPAWSRIQASIAATLATDKVIDAPRIMRVAGSINYPKPEKRNKRGYVTELTSIHIHDPDERPPVTSEQMDRAFQSRPAAPASGLRIDTGDEYGPALDRALATANIKADTEWRNNVKTLVASYVARGWTDDEILDRCDAFTLAGYTVEDTRKDVAAFIQWTREQEARNGGKYATSPTGQGAEVKPAHTQNFDHPASPDSPARPASGWRLQTADSFTADFVAPEYIVDGVIRRGMVYTLTAPTGSGKTAVMLYASTSLATGNLFCEREVEWGDVLFMAGENPDDVRARVIATMEFYSIDPTKCRLHFIAGTFSIRADMERLRAEAEKLPNLVLVVIDTFAAYFDGDDENSNAQAMDFARLTRKIAAFPSKPAVVMPAHPVKNASRQNLTPKGGSSLLNEVDGNLTLWNEAGMLTLHWQGKYRGAEFEPLQFELEKYECDRLRDAKGRLMPTILAKPLLSLRASQIAKETLSMEDKILLSIRDEPSISMTDRCVRVGLLLKDGLAHKSGMSRMFKRLSDQKLIRKFRTNWELTKDGERAVEMIEKGEKFAPDLEG